LAAIKAEEINADHLFNDFDCGESSLNEWLVHRALKNHSAGYTRVRVLSEGKRVIGFYGLAAASVMAEAVPRAVRGGQAPNPLPAALVGRFAVDREWQGRGFGESLFTDAMQRCVRASDLLGVRLVLIHALNEKAMGFYRLRGFVAGRANPLLFMQSVDRIRAGFR
jgi:GNAT superfamily N-acetyltransferase